jgi:cytochrome c-type biogenesis protein CcmF
MPLFGSFALLLALVLAMYELVMGAVALRQLSTGGVIGQPLAMEGVFSFFLESVFLRPSLRQIA